MSWLLSFYRPLCIVELLSCVCFAFNFFDGVVFIFMSELQWNVNIVILLTVSLREGVHSICVLSRSLVDHRVLQRINHCHVLPSRLIEVVFNWQIGKVWPPDFLLACLFDCARIWLCGLHCGRLSCLTVLATNSLVARRGQEGHWFRSMEVRWPSD